MKNILRNSIAVYILFLIVLTGCAKKNDIRPDAKGELSIEFDNIAGESNLQLNTGVYTNLLGEQFSISTLKYYISNIKLINTSGTEYIVPQDSSYFLIDEANAESRFCHIEVPEADYKTLTFTIGVDSLRSTMDITKRTGVLDPTGGHDAMYWGWNSGYIFFKMEGTSPVSTTEGKFYYHIGGFGGYSAPTINNIKTVTLNLSSRGVAQVREGGESNIHLLVDVMKVFNGSTRVSIAENSAVMFSDFSTKIAGNYAAMFTHDHTENGEDHDH